MFNVDKKTTGAEEGIWKEFDGSEFLITHISSLRFQRLFQRYQQAHKRKIDGGALDPAISKEIICKAMSEAILLDWRNVVDNTGTTVPYSQAAAYNALMYNAEFREWVSEISTDLAQFTHEENIAQGKG